MGNKREEKRADLRRRLVDAAERQVTEGGLGSLKARDITAEAGCALGALYTAFDDLDTLILHVNSRTLARLGKTLAAATAGHGSAEAVMQTLAAAYVDFALANRRLWTALFEHRLPDGVETPEWHRRDNAVLVEEIIRPLAALRPDLSQERLKLRARTIFAAVNGVVQLSLQGRYVGVPEAELAGEVSALVRAMTRGIHLAEPGR